MSDKLFTVAGIATDSKGNTKVRYANNLETRTKVLLAGKFTNIHLVELEESCDKFEACQLLLSNSQFDEHKQIISQELEKVNRIDEQISFKLQRQQRKLALANMTAEQVLELIK